MGKRSRGAARLETWAALAGRLLVSRASLFAWRERPDFPRIGDPPWPGSVVARVRRWREATFRAVGPSDSKLRLIVARLEKCRAEVATLRRDYVAVGDLREGAIRRFDVVCRTVDEAWTGAAGLGVAGHGAARQGKARSERAIEDSLSDWVRGVLMRLADGPELVPVPAKRRQELGARFGAAIPAAEAVGSDDDGGDAERDGTGERPDGLHAAREALARARARKLVYETRIIKGELTPCAEATDEFVRRAHALRGALEGLPRSLAPRMAGLPSEDAAKLVRAELDGVLAETARRWFARAD